MKDTIRSSLTAILISCLLASCLLPYRPDADYRAMLAASPPFSPRSPTGAAFQFRYAKPDTPELSRLRRELALEDNAGPTHDGDRLRMERIMRWLNTTTRQDGSAIPPRPLEASNLVRASVEQDAGLNCRAMSIALAECLLALGIPARTLALVPRDPSDELHVVVIAWDDDTDTWVFLDPTYATFISRPGSSGLSPLQIRKHLAEGEALEISSFAAWNGGVFPLEYFHYLSKNMYAFYSPAVSAPAYENSFGHLRVFLLPQGMPLPWNPFVRAQAVSLDEFFAPPAFD